jgi:hypothetical protein
MTEYQPIEPFPYGDEFNSVEELNEVVEKRKKEDLQLYGHAIIYIPGTGKYPERIAARVGYNGDIMTGAHCENI